MFLYLFLHIYLHKFLPKLTHYGTHCYLNLSELSFPVHDLTSAQVNNSKYPNDVLPYYLEIEVYLTT